MSLRGTPSNLHRNLKRAQSSIAMQIRSEHIRLNSYLHRRKVPGVDNPRCPCGHPSENVKHAVMACPLRAKGRAEVWRKAKNRSPEVARTVPVGWGSGETGAREREEEAIDMREVHTGQNSVIALPEGKHNNKEFHQVDEIAEHQVYCHWRQASKSHWGRDNDPVLSAGMLLEENRDMYHHRSIFVSNFRALSFYIRASIDALSGTTREIAIDATYGTNNAGMEPYAVLAELDGTGAPMAYLFVEKNNSFGTSSPGTMTQVIYQFLRVLDNLGVYPSFVDCDKDKSEINAIEQVWPSARIQLCFWHAKRAVEIKFEKSNANSLLEYSPGDVQVIQ
ncbi:hypothetical protein K3495_g687 [Podosphaera aphanis]|nr:hypothetical protein K3495_g687 [Podosphaera aphanis]